MTPQEIRGPSDRPDLDKIFKITGDELPAEVQEARQDPSLIFGKYILLNMIGRGGTGYVRKAWDTMLGQHVALKFLSREKRGDEDSAGATERIRDLLQEARLSARLRHPHIVSVFDVGCIADKFFISMQFIDGKSLNDHVAAARERGWPSPLYADPQGYLQLLGDIAGAIDYAHAFSPPIIHCDLKPSNIIVANDSTAYVVDFGLARAADASQKEDIGIRGTPEYMAPEQLSGQASDLGVWTDIYGIGGLIYMLLAGQPPLKGASADIKMLLAHKPPERPSVLLRGNPEYTEQLRNHALLPHLSRLEEVCMKCLARHPEDRYRLASRVASDLQSVLNTLKGISRRRPDQAKSHVEPADLTESRQLLFKGLEPGRISQVLRDRAQQASVIEAFRGRLAERLNARHPVVPELPRESGTTDTVRVLKVTPSRIYLLFRGEVEVAPWTGLPSDQLIALAEAAGAGDPEDRLALGLMKLAAARETIREDDAPSAPPPPTPSAPADDAPLELL